MIGLTCQYGGMPCLAYLCAKLFSLPPVEALAIFVYGCCPGGSSSNN